MKKQRKIFKKRRRQGKTNYRKRLILLKSIFPRLVVRKTNQYIILQIVESKEAEDKIITLVNSKELLKFDWPENKKGSLKSLTASYLAGYLIGRKAKKIKIQKAILDSGLIPSTSGSRVYAAVKGAKDAGLDINCDESVIPSMDKIQKYDFFNKVREEIEGGNK